jgi:hypothetical protein
VKEATRERDARLEALFAVGWTTDLFAQFWAAPGLDRAPVATIDA